MIFVKITFYKMINQDNYFYIIRNGNNIKVGISNLINLEENETLIVFSKVRNYHPNFIMIIFGDNIEDGMMSFDHFISVIFSDDCSHHFSERIRRAIQQ